MLWFKLILPLVNQEDVFLISLDHAWQLIKMNIDGSLDFDHMAEYKPPSFDQSLNKVEGVASQVIVFLYCLKRIPHKFNEWADPIWAPMDLT